MATELVQLVSIILVIHSEFLYAQKFIRGCVFESSSRLRYNDAAFTVHDIDFTLCTHYIYSSAKVDVAGLTVEPADRSDEEGPTGLYKQFNDGKKKQQGTKTILSVGGIDAANDAAFEFLSRRDSTFQSFSRNAVKYVKDQRFDGINIYWEPAIANSGTTILPKLLQALREVINQDSSPKMLLTMTGSAAFFIIGTRYDVPKLNQFLDYVFVNIMSLVSRNVATFIAPLYSNYGIVGGQNSLNNSIHYWKGKSMPYNKLVMGITALGHYAQLKDPSQFHPGVALSSAVLRGHRYNIDSRLAYPEICALMRVSQKYYDNVQKSAYMVNGDEWVGYIDTVSLQERIQFMRVYGLAGMYFTSLDDDDFSGTACNAGKFPLISFVREKLDPVRPTAAPPETTTIEIDTTFEAETDNNSELITTAEINGEHAQTTRKTITEMEKKKKGDSISFVGYILLIFVFILGLILGHLFMRIARYTYEKYK